MNKYKILAILIYCFILVVCIAVSAWIFNVVMSSDMSEWLKYILLK